MNLQAIGEPLRACHLERMIIGCSIESREPHAAPKRCRHRLLNQEKASTVYNLRWSRIDTQRTAHKVSSPARGIADRRGHIRTDLLLHVQTPLIDSRL